MWNSATVPADEHALEIAGRHGGSSNEADDPASCLPHDDLSDQPQRLVPSTPSHKCAGSEHTP